MPRLPSTPCSTKRGTKPGWREVTSIDQIAPNQLGTLTAPYKLPISKWDTYEIVARSSDNVYDCTKITLNLRREKQMAEWVQEPINQATALCKDAENRTYKWTIENPPFWKSVPR